MFEQFGLTALGSLVYERLAREPDDNLETLGKTLGFSAPEISRAYEELRGAGVLTDGKYGRIVLPVKEAANILILRQESDLIAKKAQISASRLYLEQIERTASHSVASETEIVVGPTTVKNKITMLSEQASKHMDILVPGGPMKQSSIDSGRDLDLQSYQRG